MSNRIETILIVGGGTAGWLAAAFLNRALNRPGGPGCQVTLIESADIETIGVGEATIPTLRETMAFLGLDEAEWMTRCQATFKMAIKFVNWTGRPGPDVYWHPFGTIPKVREFELSHYWLKRKLRGSTAPLTDTLFSAISLCQAHKAPKVHTDPSYDGPIRYAYHLDAGLLATYLKETAKARGVIHLVDTVQEVVLDEKGYISHLKTAKLGDLHADLFIDCTGFRGLLINQALGEPFISYAEALLCDRAIAIPTARPEEGKRINPYTTATALSAGWAWHTPLFHRHGNGYIYASAFISPEEAEREFRAYLGPAADEGKARHIRMRVGKTRRTWVKNCVSIGLSSGFIEPLESTGIWLVEVGLRHLFYHFPDKTFPASLTNQYNQLMTNQYEQIRDFIVLHYCLTQREDTPFWRGNKYHLAIPDSLQTRLEGWRFTLPLPQEIGQAGFFRAPSYACILAGMGYLPDRGLPILQYAGEAEADQAFSDLQAETDRLNQALPDHYETLRWLHLQATLRQAHREELARREVLPQNTTR